MSITVIVPSRLKTNPSARPHALFVERAIASVRAQSRADEVTEIILAVDPVCAPDVPPHVRTGNVKVVEGERFSQAAAVNAAFRMATGDVLAILEDDDTWVPTRLEYALAALSGGYDIVTSNQREIDSDGSLVNVNDFPTPSGWVVRRDKFKRHFWFDEAVKWHVDVEWLGYVVKAGMKRVHQVERGAIAQRGDRTPTGVTGLALVKQVSALLETNEARPLVDRLVNPDGGMHRTITDPKAGLQSKLEFKAIMGAYGGVPW